MSTNVGYATLTVIPSAKGFSSALSGEVNPGMGGVGRGAGAALGGGILGGLKPLMGGLAVGIGAAVVGGFLKDAIGAASDLGETAAKTGQIFGKDALPALDKFAAGAATTMGQSKQSALDAAATFGVFGKSAGLSGKDLSGFSTQMVGLSGDLASFSNTSPEEAINAIGSALRGEAEPIRKYGILLDDATLRQRAMTLGIIKNTKDALTPQQKVLAAQAEILAQTSDAQGDFARTSGGLANQQRILSAQLENGKAKLGEVFLPLATGAVTALNKVIPAIQGISSKVTDFVTGLGNSDAGKSFSKMFGNVGPILDTVKNAFAALIPIGQQIMATFVSTVLPALKGAMDRILPAVMNVFNGFKGFITVVLPIVQAFVAGLWAKLQPLLPRITVIFQGIAQVIGLIITAIGAIVTVGLNVISGAFKVVTAVISYVWTNFGTYILNFIGTVWAAIIGVVEPAINLVKEIIMTVISIFTGDWAGAWEHIKGILSAAWSLIASIVTGALSIVSSAITGVLGIIGGLFSSAWSGITSVVSTAWGTITGVVSTGISKALGFIGELPGRAASALATLGSKIAGVVSSAWSTASTAVATGVTTAVGFIGELPGKAVSALAGLGSTLLSAGGDLIGGFIQGIQNKAGNLIGVIKSTITDKLPQFVKDALGIRSPSRVFMEIGGHTADGMALGIKKGAKGVQKAANGLVPSAPAFGSPDLGSGSGTAAGPAGGPLIGQVTFGSGDNNRNDIEELLFQLRTLNRGGVYARA